VRYVLVVQMERPADAPLFTVMVNEFVGRSYPCSSFIPAGPAYANISPANRICATTGAKAGLDFVLGTDYVETSFSYVHSHLWRNLGILVSS
jgi:ATP-binding cassette subfamily G (WHITE) protein 2 (PDR)